MSLTFEPKTSRDALAPTDPETFAAQAALYLHAADPSAVFAKHDAIAEGRTPRPRPVLAREVTSADRMLPDAKTAWCDVCEKAVTPSHLEPDLGHFRAALAGTAVPSSAPKPSLRARLRHALSWKG